jgi:hypothetical protein
MKNTLNTIAKSLVISHEIVKNEGKCFYNSLFVCKFCPCNYKGCGNEKNPSDMQWRVKTCTRYIAKQEAPEHSVLTKKAAGKEENKNLLESIEKEICFNSTLFDIPAENWKTLPALRNEIKKIKDHKNRICPHCGAYPVMYECGEKREDRSCVAVCSVCKEPVKQDLYIRSR